MSTELHSAVERVRDANREFEIACVRLATAYVVLHDDDAVAGHSHLLNDRVAEYKAALDSVMAALKQ